MFFQSFLGFLLGIGLFHCRSPTLDPVGMCKQFLRTRFGMRTLDDSVNALEIIGNHLFKHLHPDLQRFLLTGAKLLHSHGQVLKDNAFELCIDRTQNRLVVVLGIQFRRYHLKREERFFGSTLFLVLQAEPEQTGFVQEGHIAGQPTEVIEEEIFYLAFDMPRFRSGAFVQAIELDGDMIFVGLVDNRPQGFAKCHVITQPSRVRIV